MMKVRAEMMGGNIMELTTVLQAIAIVITGVLIAPPSRMWPLRCGGPTKVGKGPRAQ